MCVYLYIYPVYGENVGDMVMQSTMYRSSGLALTPFSLGYITLLLCIVFVTYYVTQRVSPARLGGLQQRWRGQGDHEEPGPDHRVDQGTEEAVRGHRGPGPIQAPVVDGGRSSRPGYHGRWQQHLQNLFRRIHRYAGEWVHACKYVCECKNNVRIISDTAINI